MTHNNSIWQDVYYETTGSTVQFALSYSGNVIYNGKAYAKPYTNTIKVNLTNICQNYLNSKLPDLTSFSGSVNTEIYKDFVLSTYNETADTWTTGDTYVYLMNYDREYEPTFNTGDSLNIPVNYHTVSGMVTPSSNYVSTTISTDNAQYNVSSCGQYALIYLNARGGWDSFLFEGKCRKSDSYTISKYSSNYDNNTTGFGSTRYMNIIKTSWELNSGWLTETQSNIFVRNLCSSNSVYLQDLITGDIIPVVITDTTQEYKKYDSETGISPINYTVKVETSQEYKRK